MKFVYTGGPYTEFRGYVFAYGKPTTVLDRGALEAIAKRADFKEWKDEPQEVETAAAPAVLKRRTLTVKRK
jgi:hypothetical protein